MTDKPWTRILAYCLPWHLRQSDAFSEILVKPLSPWIDMRLTAWDGIQSLPLPEGDHEVCFLEILPPLHDINWRERPLTWIPMWDHVATFYQEPQWWQALPRAWRIVSFCDAVNQIAQSQQRAVFPVRYWREPGEEVPAPWNGPRALFYWNRLGLVGPGFIERLCRALRIDRLIFRPEMDPHIPVERHYHLPARLGNTIVEELPFINDKDEYLSRLNAVNFVLAPRPMEGVGLIPVDALARGCAVLSVDLPSVNEYIHSGENGYLLTPFAVPEWPYIRKRIMERRNSARMTSAATWWSQGHDYFLSEQQDWKTLGRIDWFALGAQARKDSERGAQIWRQTLPALARFLKGKELESASPDTSAKVSVAEVFNHRLQVTPRTLVSICLPHLNSMPFTRARLDSILAQTWPHWECIVIDSGSTDGSLELLLEAERQDPRIRLFKQPRQGIYPAFNESIRHAKGDFVYIATADDTLASNGLELMVQGLLRHPDCGACHTPLVVIDEQGNRIHGYYERFDVVRYFGRWMDIPHIRRRPHDAVLFSLIPCVYASVTQMLYRRKVVNQAGPFPTKFDSEGDFAWQMRLASIADVLHLPLKVGTWRIHPQQATQVYDSVKMARRRLEMVKANADFLYETNPGLSRQVSTSEFGFPYRLEAFRAAGAAVPAYRARARALLKAIHEDPGVVKFLHYGQWRSDIGFDCKLDKLARTFMSRRGLDRLLESVP
jgi:glycosyltransferase involved in cell wall biosynthesis